MSIKIAGCTISIARTDPEFDAVFNVRHQVYCKELGFEPARDDERECDQDDMRAIHLLATDEQTQDPIGTVRIIIPNENDEHPFKRAYAAQNIKIPFVFETSNDNNPSCERSILRPDEHNFHATRSTEISRLSVVQERRCGHVRSGLGPSLLLMMAATVVNTNLRLDNGSPLTGAYFITTQSIIRMANERGVQGFQQIAPEIEHHGRRAAYWIPTDRAVESLSEKFSTLYSVVQSGMAADMKDGPTASAYWMSADPVKPARRHIEELRM